MGKIKISNVKMSQIFCFLNKFGAKLIYADSSCFFVVYEVLEKIMNEFERLNLEILKNQKLKLQINHLELDISNLMLQINVFEERLRVRDKRYDELRKKYDELNKENEFFKIGRSEEK